MCIAVYFEYRSNEPPNSSVSRYWANHLPQCYKVQESHLSPPSKVFGINLHQTETSDADTYHVNIQNIHEQK